MSDNGRTMSGAELKVQLTGMGLTPGWLADRLGVTTRTVIRWFDLDEVPERAIAEIDWLTQITSDEMTRIYSAMENGVLRTERTNAVAFRNTLPASWHRALTFRVLEHARREGATVMVAYR